MSPGYEQEINKSIIWVGGSTEVRGQRPGRCSNSKYGYLHGRALGRFADRLGIPGFVLLARLPRAASIENTVSRSRTEAVRTSTQLPH